MRSIAMPSLSHQTESLERLNKPFGLPKGTPLSDLMACGSPRCRKSCSKAVLLQVDETEIVAHEADEPNALVDLFDAEPLTGKHGRDIDPRAACDLTGILWSVPEPLPFASWCSGALVHHAARLSQRIIAPFASHPSDRRPA